MEINELLRLAVDNGASDIHLTVGIPPVFRMDGMLIKLDKLSKLLPEDTQKFAYSIMNAMQIDHFEKNGEVDFSYSILGICRFRINIYRQRGSIGLALRAVPLRVPSIEELGLPEVIKEMAMMKRGLILVTGPTGSGKSTTLAAMINYINQNQSSHVLTLEDPIEYLHRHQTSIVNQRELGLDTKSYGDALRAALRQDPDVILIGEMRDLETISTAITAAETGHLVLSTLHTMGAVSTIDRIIDVFPPDQQQQIRIQLSAVLQGVVSQQLLRKSDNNGRIAAMEIMLCNAAIRNHIREGKTYQIMNAIQTNRKDGMIAMDAFLADLYHNNKITYEDAISHAVDKDFIAKML